MELPATTLRLFAGYNPAELTPGSGFVIGRLLEEGEEADLHWLAAHVTEQQLGDWLAGPGGRQLSRRGRAFWQLVLGREAGKPAAGAEELWPL